ncbi:MAG: hypothetical protein ACK2TV_00210, partial [Anaerolineales bacterium]
MNSFEISEREVFILRFWQSRENDAPLRGQIQHIRSGQTFSIREPEGILRFMQEEINANNEKECRINHIYVCYA